MSDKFNLDDWHVEITKGPVESAFLESKFPREVESEEISDEPSSIDSEYYDVIWLSDHPEYPKVRAQPGMFIAFMHKDLHQRILGVIGEPPDEYAYIRAKFTVEKRDAPDDKKSHPKWKCWLEVTEATFLSWEVDEFDDGDLDVIDRHDDQDEGDNRGGEEQADPARISAAVGDPSEPIAQKLESLLSAFEAKGADGIRDSMLPGLSREEIAQRSSWFPASLPEPILELYEWANGQANDAWNEPNPFWFRDMGFLSLEGAAAEYKSMMSTYGIDNALEDDGVLLATSFPIAAFNGGWYVVPAEQHELRTANAHPVVCVFEGIDMLYHSVQKMLDTCNEWVRSSSYAYEDASLDEDEEMKIWEKHNPGVFDD